MTAAELAARLDGKRNGDGWQAKCPAHEDRTPSLSISDGREGVLLHCHAGCSIDAICSALGIAKRDLFADSNSRDIIATYDYADANGALLYQVVRFAPKDFRQRRPDGLGGWTWNLNGTRRVLYRLPELRAAIGAGKRVFVVEGEKDVAAVERAGYTATCNSGGAGKWRPEYSADLKGADVVIVADKDAPGRAHARDIARLLDGVASRVVTVEAAEGKDVTDHLAAGRKLAELVSVTLSAPLRVESTKETKEGGVEGTSFVSFVLPELDVAALSGLPGEFIDVVGPHTEADPAALLVQFLVAFGSCAGRNTWFSVEADRHHLNLFALLVGVTSKGRKGTSWGHVRNLFARIGDTWATSCILGGLSSGEGLIWAVRDPIEKQEPVREKQRIIGYQTVIVDEGIADKRLLVLEPEFASTLRVMTRDGNTVSAIIRQAWDDGMLRAMAKNSPARASNAHISIIGHVTRDELRRELTATDAANGFANRFLFVNSRRSKALPEGGHLPPDALDGIVRRLADAVVLAMTAGELRRDDAARALWASVYPALSEGRPGLLGAATARAEAQVTRLSCLYALLDHSTIVRAEHLQAALALWDYCAASAKTVFGDAVGDALADALLGALRRGGVDGLTRTDLSAALGRNYNATEINRALGLLYERGYANFENVRTDGRPREVWRATGSTKETNKGAAE
jgi:5S rRNA maturation endonuclease (ribonuclease M5)